MIYCNTDHKCCFSPLFRRVDISTAGAPGWSGADAGGKDVAAEEPGSSSNSLAETHQPRGQHAALSGVPEPGEASTHPHTCHRRCM